MSSFNWKKNIEDSIKDGLIITTGALGIFFGLNATTVKPPKASLDAMDILKFTGGIRGRVLVKDYAVYKKVDQRVIQQNFYDPYRVIKLLFITRKVWRSAPLNHWSVVCPEAASLHALFRSGKGLCACQKHLSC